MEHIRNMLEERESLTAEYERDNEQLRAELALMKHQQGEGFILIFSILKTVFVVNNVPRSFVLACFSNSIILILFLDQLPHLSNVQYITV